MKSKKLPKDTKVAVYMRAGREEQLSFKFTAEQVKVLRDALLTYNKPEKTAICTDLFEHLGNRLRDYKGRESANAD